jgi:hypothetical protein
MDISPELDSKVRPQAERLRDQLDELASAPTQAPDVASLQRIARAANELRDILARLTTDAAARLTSAELGFMPGPALENHLDRHRQDWDQRLMRLAAGAQASGSWGGVDGQQSYQDFLIRGYIRGFAHLWRQHTEQAAEPDPGKPFFEFASRWLRYADVLDEHEQLIATALASDWRMPAP